MNRQWRNTEHRPAYRYNNNLSQKDNRRHSQKRTALQHTVQCRSIRSKCFGIEHIPKLEHNKHRKENRQFIPAFLPVFIVVIFGTSVVNIILKYIPDVVMHGLEVSGGMLPALGFALIIHMIGKSQYIPFMLIGFFLCQMTGWSNLILGVFGVCIAMIVIMLKRENNGEGDEA